MNGYLIAGVVIALIVLLLATNKKLVETLKNIYKIEELRKRIAYTLGLLLVFRLGCFVVIPGIDPNALGEGSALADQMNSNTLLGLLDVFSGGAFANAAILALGVMPYITASIIIQLLGMMVQFRSCRRRVRVAAANSTSGHVCSLSEFCAFRLLLTWPTSIAKCLTHLFTEVHSLFTPMRQLFLSQVHCSQCGSVSVLRTRASVMVSL